MPDVSAALDKRIKELEEPASPEAIGVRIRILMENYWGKESPEEIKTGMLSDWMRILSKYPLWAIDVACIRHLKGERARYKPLPADILAEIPDIT